MLRAFSTSDSGGHGSAFTFVSTIVLLTSLAYAGTSCAAEPQAPPRVNVDAVHAYTSGDNTGPLATTRLSSGATIVALQGSKPALAKILPDGTITWSFGYAVDLFRPWLTSIGESAYLADARNLDQSNEGERTEFRVLAFDEAGTPRIARTITTPNIAWLIGFGATRDSQLWLAFRRRESTTLVVLDRDGNPLRQMGFRTPAPLYVERFAALDDGAFAFAGTDGKSCMAGVLSAKGSVEWVKSFAGNEGTCLEVAASGDRIALGATVRDPSGWRILLLSRKGELISDRAIGPTMPIVFFLVGGDGGSFLVAGPSLTSNSFQLVSVDRAGKVEGQWSSHSSMFPYPILASGPSGGKRSLVMKLDQSHWAMFELGSARVGDVPPRLERLDSRWKPVQTVERALGLTAFDDVVTSQLVLRPVSSAQALTPADNAPAAAQEPERAADRKLDPMIPVGPVEPPGSAIDTDPAVRSEFAALFKSRSWKVLDAKLDQAIATRHQEPTSTWTLHLAHQALTLGSPGLSGVSEEKYFAALDEWIAAVPASHHPRILRAQSWHAIAWTHRGPGYSSTVTDEGSKLWDHYEELALKEIRAVDKLAPVSPEFYSVYLDLLGANSLDQSSLLERGMRAAPLYHYLYQARLSFLRPQWGGSQEELWKFLRLVHARLSPDDLEQVWGRIIFETWRITSYYVSPADIDRELTERSLRRIKKSQPDARPAAYRRAALTCTLNWKDAAQEAFNDPIMKYQPELTDKYMGNPISYAICRTWALSADPPAPAKQEGWAASLFENAAAFADGRRASGFRSFLARDGESVVGVTAVAPLLDPAKTSRPRKLGALESWTMTSNATKAKALSVSAIRTREGGVVEADAVLLNVERSSAAADVAFVPSEVEAEDWSSVWIVARNGNGPIDAHFGMVVSVGSNSLEVKPVHLDRGPQLSGAPVVDAQGKLVATVTRVGTDGDVNCEKFSTTRKGSLSLPQSGSSSTAQVMDAMMKNAKPYVLRSKEVHEPLPAAWLVAGTRGLAAGNTQPFNDEIARYGDAIKPGLRMYRILIGGGTVQSVRVLDYSVPMNAIGKTTPMLWNFQFPADTNGAYDVAIAPDHRAAIIAPLDGGP
ncbi:MAG: DUF4034 domain-containing protein [Thermoanaerobaculia bacterium]|jgi:hypothetical protein